MNCKFAKTNCPAAPLRRAALAGSVALSVLFGALTGAGAQTTPNPNQVNLQPTPYSAPSFHAGGTALYPFLLGTLPSVGTSSVNPGGTSVSTTPYQALSPIYNQLMGTPTGFALLNTDGTLNSGTSVVTEIPSFLLGNYIPTDPPTELATDAGAGNLTYFANHFRDDQFNIASWSAPFTYLTANTTNLQPIADDDSDTAVGEVYAATAGTASYWRVAYTDSGAWQTEANGTADDNVPAPNGNPGYHRAAVTNAATATAAATWTFTAPTAALNSTVAGLYTVTLHLPDPVTDNTQAAYPENRISDAHYVIKVTTGGVTTTVFDGRLSQTETNDPQYVAGPFDLAASSVVTVTLDNTTSTDLANEGANLQYYVLADTVSLTPGSIAGGANGVNGSPVAINATQYPEIQDALYFGQALDTNIADATYGQRVDDNVNPYGDATIGTQNTDATHDIHQLVYFGRYETIALTDGAGNLVNATGGTTTVIAGVTVPITTPITEQVGAIYCVNGITGDIVWRFQTPDVLTRTTGAGGVPVFTRANGSQAVFTTPTVARVNVLVPQGTVPETYKAATKLVVIVGDDNGQVYCLDAIGNRNGISNTTVLGAATAASRLFSQPIYIPNAPLNTGTTIDTTVPHVGTTRAYWIYRPDQTKDLTSKAVRTFDATRDLPVPQAFGLASPTVYTDPAVGIDTTTLRPDVAASTQALASNATVLIGNSNGTLYALDAGGVAVAPIATTPFYLDSADPYNTSRYVGILSDPVTYTTPAVIQPYTYTADGSPVPTAVPKWWFAVNGAQTNSSDASADVSITSAPALRLTGDPSAGAPATTSFATAPELYFTTGNDTTNQGRVYALSLTTGPVKYAAAGAAATALTPGSAGYNNVARPDWVFPNAYTNTGTGVAAGKIRPPLGSISGSPVVFTNPDDRTTRVYVAANSSEDDVAPADEGRIWAIRTLTESATDNPSGANSTGFNAAGNAVWCYPDYFDPNAYAPNNNETTPTRSLGNIAYAGNLPPDPLGAFQDATPAIGVVQFPTTITFGPVGTITPYVHTDSAINGVGNRTQTDVRGQNVPMLYVGAHSEAPDSSTFFALDLDGSTDPGRDIFNYGQAGTAPVGATPSAAGFVCSPLLIVNASATTGFLNGALGPGNGGAVFITGTDNDLYELSATPTSDVGTVLNNAAGAPQFPVFAQYGGFGPTSSPTAAAFSGVSGALTLGGTATGGGAQDWVYGGDSKLGIARGITPKDLTGSGAAGISLGSGGTGPDVLAPGYIPEQFPLHSYIFDDSAAHPGTSTDMSTAYPLGAALPAFEWGQPVYLRLTNVVPPNDAVLADGALATTNPSRLMHDSTLAAGDPGSDIVYTNGGPITIQLSDVADANNASTSETDTVTIPATVLSTLSTAPPGNGFIARTGPGDQDGDSGKATASGDMLKDVNGNAWIGAGTYAIGDGSNRKNTPGTRRRIVSAIQVAQAYRVDAAGAYTFVGSVTLQITVDSSANAVTQTSATGVHSLQRIAAVDQPTFAILNPLAVQAGGYPLALGAYAAAPAAGAVPVVPTTGIEKTGVLGPFGGIHTGAALTTDDLQAFANGNRIPTSTADLPANGVVTGVGTTRRNQTHVLVITATGDINHGTTGDNADPRNLNATAPIGRQAGSAIGSGYVLPNATFPNAPYGPYAMDVADRSVLGYGGGQIHNLTVQPASVRWHDNSALSGSNVYGPGAMINPLPWETEPTSGPAGTNTSVDYPDIGASRLGHVLMPNQQYQAAGGNTPAAGGDITNEAGSLDPSIGNVPSDRTVFADPLQVQVRVPLYQPANLQVYDQTNVLAQTTPDQLTTASKAFPEGYVANEIVYVDSNHNHKFDSGEAYREFRVFTGVPVDMTTTIDTTTVDLGRLPQGFGLETENYPLLGTFMPYPTATQLGATAQSIRNPGYVQFFKPLQISNRGNTNLLNVHLDQKANKGGTDTPLPLTGDSLDPLDVFPAYDANSALTGPHPALPNGTASGDGSGTFLLRSSLDDDLVAAYGHNPAIASAVSGGTYPVLGATFHKARVNDGSPSTLTVPDVPRDNNPGYLGYLPTFTTVPPIADGSGLFDPNNNAVAAQPYIALAVPQGTPVGTYSQSVRLFEGVDPGGYANIGLNGTNYVPILPPQYGHHVVNPALNNPDGSGTYTPSAGDTYDGLLDTWQLTANGTPMQPASSAAVVKATVTEARLTDNMSRGDLPQVDNGPITVNGKPGVADFLPSAFRDPGTGSVSLYWTSSRGATATQPYTLIGANLPFNSTYFQPGNANTTWWKQINLNAALPTGPGFNSGISVTTPAGGNAYAFVQNIAGAPYGNSLYCAPVAPDTGIPTGKNVLVTRNTSQPTNGARGLTFSTAGLTFTDPVSGTTFTPPNLWGFWYGGARGRSVIYYAAAQSGDVDSGTASAFGVTAALPIPAGLVSVSDPNAVLTTAPNAAGAAVPVIEVTYTGVGPDGNSDIYVSRYQPYTVLNAQHQPIPDPSDTARNVVALALLPSPPITEQLDSTDGSLWWQARDVAWANPYYVPANGGGFTVTNGIDVSLNGTDLNLGSVRPTLDRTSGTLVYTKLPSVTVAGKTVTVNAVYVDLARGRVRFSFSPQVSASTGLSVYASFTPQARRITTDPRADSAPVSFLDEALKQNEANSAGANLGTVTTNRYWFLWRKSGASGTSTTPTLYYKTQRLTIDLQLRDATTGLPIGIKLKNLGTAAAPQYVPDVTVTTAGGTQLFNSAASTNLADVDWVRGRIYLPLTDGAGNALEGASIKVTGTDADGNAINFTDIAHWLDEPRYNDKTSPTTAANPPAGITSATTASATGDAAVPIDTIVNESNVTAFLDPSANATTNSHKVWLFWNSTRNGTADVYYETISPRFSASVGQ